MTVPGYLFVYVSNEDEQAVDIYFDDLKVTHTHSPLQQISDYYPFGAVANTSWTRADATPNPYLYNAGSELNEKTAWYETALRSYDPYLGRFNGVDVMADKYAGTTPFNYAFNSPAVLNDPTGAEPGQLIRTDDTPWEAPAYTRGKYQYYDNFAGWAAGNQWWSGGIDRSWSSAGNFYGKFGPGDGGALHSFMKGVLAGSHAAKARSIALRNPQSARDHTKSMIRYAWKSTPQSTLGIYSASSGHITGQLLISTDQTIYPDLASNPVEANPAIPILIALEELMALVGLGGLAAVLDHVIDRSTDRVWYHYTDSKGFLGIVETRTIYPNQKGKVYISDMPFNAAEAFQNLFLGNPLYKGKSDYVVAFSLDRVQESSLQWDVSSPFEYVHFGSLKPLKFYYQGTNPF